MVGLNKMQISSAEPHRSINEVNGMVFMVGGGPAQVPEAGKRVLDRPGPEDILRCLGKAACGSKAAACARWHVLFHL